MKRRNNQKIMKKKVERQKWLYDWERSMSLFVVWSIATVWISKRAQKFFPMEGILISHNNRTAGYYKTPLILKSSQRLVKRFMSSKQFSKQWQKDVKENYLRLRNWCRTLQRIDLNKRSNNQLNNLYQQYFELYTNLLNHVGVIRTFNQTAVDHLANYLKKRIKNNIPEILADLSSTTKKSFINQSEADFLKIALLKQQKRKTDQAIDNFLKKWQWISVGYNDEPPLSKKTMGREVAKLAKGDPKKNLRAVDKSYSQLKSKKRAILKSYFFSPQIKNLIVASELAAYFKDFVRAGHNYAHFYSQSLFKEIGKRLGLTFRDVKMLLPKEVAQTLRDNRIDYSVINQRKKNYFIEATSKGIKFYTGQKALKKEKQAIGGIRKVNMLKGVMAHTGKIIKGKVKVLRSKKDYQGEKNYILVSPMTTPDLAPYIKKAKAIVTDEGGLTSHAAIVSRELKIPCIVGTKIATQVLKNGDKVEVDATKGIIRKIK